MAAPKKSPFQQQQAKLLAKADKKFREKYKYYEPSDLTEIENIIQRVIEQTQTVNLKDKIANYNIALEKITLTIENSEKLFKVLDKEGCIDEPENFYDELDKAFSVRKCFKIKIASAKLEEATNQAKSNGNPKDVGPSEAGRFLPEQSTVDPDENMNAEQVAEFLGVSLSTVRHLTPKGKIPRICIGKRVIYSKKQIIDWKNAGGTKVNSGIASNKRDKNANVYF